MTKTFKQKYEDGDYKALGPKGEELFLKSKFDAGHYELMPFIVEKAKGAWFTDVDGNRAVDYLAGYSAILDHNNPSIKKALIKHLAQDGADLVSGVLTSPEYLNLCERLCNFTGFDKFLAKSDGGAATDSAFKGLLRHGLERGIENPEIIMWEDYFHGRTVPFSAGATFDEHQQVGLPENLRKNIKNIPFFDYQALEDVINPNTVGMFIEVHQGEGGPKFSNFEDYKQVMEIARKHNLIVGADEIQTGFGRCGYNMSHEEYSKEDEELRPDFITIGKAIGAGACPVSGILGNKKFMSIYTPGTEGSTYGGCPRSSNTALAALNLIEKEKIGQKAQELGDYIGNKLDEHGIVSEHRGSLIRIELPGVESAKPACYEMLLGENINPRVFMKYGHTEKINGIQTAFTRMAPVIIPMHKDLKLVDKTIDKTIAPTLLEAMRQEQ